MLKYVQETMRKGSKVGLVYFWISRMEDGAILLWKSVSLEYALYSAHVNALEPSVCSYLGGFWNC